LEKDFIEKCREGDKLALQQLYKFYAPRMKGICLRYVHSVHEAEDVFQDSFIKVLKSIKTYSYKGSFDGWIKRIVINTAIDHYKSNYYNRTNLSYEEAGESEQDTLEIADQLSANELLEIIKKMPHGYRMVFNLYAIEGYTHYEIAAMMQITESTSRSQLCKARSFIKNILRQYEFVLNEKRNS
jgi:RNA polymerase sigma-70 factor (ECF subfamily)